MRECAPDVCVCACVSTVHLVFQAVKLLCPFLLRAPLSLLPFEHHTLSQLPALVEPQHLCACVNAI